MKTRNLIIMSILAMATVYVSCNQKNKTSGDEQTDTFKYKTEQFADVKILRYQIPGFNSLSLNQKKLLYYLSQAALCGRDIIYDQNFKYNLVIRRTLEAIIDKYTGDRKSEDFEKFMLYTKRVWFCNGIHHHYSSDKFLPEFSESYFKELVKNSPDGKFPLKENENLDQFLETIVPIIFDPALYPKRINLDPSKDLITNSACNFYENISQHEVEKFYERIKDEKAETPVSYGLNSKLVKENNKITEKVYKIGGMYSPAIEKIVYWLEQAKTVAENKDQEAGFEKLIEYYKTGDLKTWDDYNVLWVKDLASSVDYVNGFIEVYGDPLGMKATWESVVNFKDVEATKRAETISQNAQWFEDNSPVDPRFKKKEVKGVSAKVITVVQLGGECHPSTPIGINLPNANWIRKQHGSKSVTMDNIMYSYDQSSLGGGSLEEFCYSQEEIDRAKKYGYLAGNLNTDMHECVGHGSGQLLPGVSSEAMKNYHSALEESRADLFALYFIMDQKMVDLKLMPNLDVAKAEYDTYIRNGLMTQLVRIELGKDIEQAHMRNRQLISKWVFEKGEKDKVIEKKTKEGKTFYTINDYDKLRSLFGELLKEIQRIKSEGDFNAGKELVEKYAIKIDPVLHKEVKERYEKLKLAPYAGFINPILKPVMKNNEIIDVKVEYPDDFTEQMLYYSKNYSFLPDIN
ncbi:MAG: dipeptidyl peptidase 3 [Bacteroidales bacterium]|jgi:dipeptidyl-peptidase-3|nr:dipeptidyl peptidase 3 [Bacteroidales bacterium]